MKLLKCTIPKKKEIITYMSVCERRVEGKCVPADARDGESFCVPSVVAGGGDDNLVSLLPVHSVYQSYLV